MAMAISALPRFRSAAAHYRAGRPHYAPLLIHRVARIVGLSCSSRLLDLGCGPGLLAVAFAPLVSEVVAMDPEQEMLAQVEQQAVANVTPRLGGSGDLSQELGRLRLVMMGRSFHWMDRVETLKRLDARIEPGGAVALFSTHHPDVPKNGWVEDFRLLLRRYAGDDPTRSPTRSPGWHGHEAVLLDSPFAHIEMAAVIERRQVSVASLTDRALSMSGTSPDRLGPRVEAFTSEIIGLLGGQAVKGMVAEVVESRAVIAFRPGEQPA